MESWFSDQSEQPFTIFGTSHIMMLVIFLIVSISILSMANLLRKLTNLHLVSRYALLCLLLAAEISYQTWAIVHGLWSAADHLPLHLCGIASLMGIIALITYHPKLIKITYFIGVVPAAIAIITPDMPHGYQHFRFWKFFLHHMVISWTSLFLIVTTSVRITWKDLLETFSYLILYAFLMSFINHLTGANYLYLENPPLTGTPLDWMGEGFLYYIHLGFTAFFVFVTMVILYKLSRNINR